MFIISNIHKYIIIYGDDKNKKLIIFINNVVIINYISVLV